VELYSNKIVVELLWTLKSHSLGQSEDQVKGVSCLHFILLVIILGVLHLMVHSFVSTFESNGVSRLAGFYPLQVFFNGNLVVESHRIPTFWPH
jgi:hypothetical protein